MSKLYDVWVISEKTKQWERYTNLPFESKAAAAAWAKAYIPNAATDVRPVPRNSSHL
jgi:hypothetical protein